MKKISFTVIVENSAQRKDLKAEHGLSIRIETDSGVLLWDTGQSNLLLSNADKLGFSIQTTTHIAISHGHYDHTGGLIQSLIMAPGVYVHGHPNIFIKRYSGDAFSTASIGMPFDRDTVESLCRSLILTAEPSEILPGIFTTGQIPRKTAFEDTGGDFFLEENCLNRDMILDDQALYFKTADGIVVILGCAHAGVVNTMNFISDITGEDKIFAVFGGMHLYKASTERLKATADAFSDYDVQLIGPCHCTGYSAVCYFRSRFPSHLISCTTGSSFTFETKD